MVLAEVLDGVPVTKLFSSMYGRMVLTQDISLRSIQYDSRKVGHDDMFVAIRGIETDGHKFIDIAISRGATVVVMQDDAVLPDSFFTHAGVIKIVVQDSRKALALMTANFYGHPSRRLRLIGVTGTNGKTTTTHLIKSILETQGATVGLIGTIEYKIGDEVMPATHTTPESLELNQLLVTMVAKGCSAVVMEVSSHALALHRVYGLNFSAGVFTNLTQDHLDFHGSMNTYFEAKKKLFDNLSDHAYAVTNSDDAYGSKIVEATQASVITYSSRAAAMVSARDVQLTVGGLKLSAVHGEVTQPLESPLTGQFNVSNILAAYATGVALGVSDETIAAGIGRLRAVRGRFEQIASPKGWTAIVDYAHTPDALEHCLQTIHEILPKKEQAKIITVFGCGGNRDREKRPKMGRIASELSDITIVTSDNPRRENPESIIHEVMGGVLPGATVYTEVDRRSAILKGLMLAEHGDVVLIAGKGHEDYQVIGDARSHFDDREEVEAFIRSSR